jgi:hypothetical protein
MANRRAFVVAINDYPGDGNDLPSCVEDARGFTELLQSAPYGFQEVRTLLDGEATIEAVTDGLGWLFGTSSQSEAGVGPATPEDRLVFYYSGHGFRTERDGVLRECLCLHDGFFFDDELSKQTQGLAPGVLTVVLDSCHSGGMDKRFFETLSAGKSGGDGSVERVRVKTWIPDAAELVKVFEKEDKSIPFKPFGCAPLPPRRAKSSGSTKAYAGAAAKMKQAKESAEAQVNGLLITACQADQTASASSSQTQGRSAFTFCLLNAIERLGGEASSGDGIPASSLFDAVAQDLAAHQFKQTPALIEPPNSPGLRSRSFLTLQAMQAGEPVTSGQGKGFQARPATAQPHSATAQPATTRPSPTASTTQTTNQGEQHMSSQSSTPLSDSEAKVLQAVLPAILPSILQYRTKSPSGTTGASSSQDPVTDEKFWGPVVAAAITAAPNIYNAIRGKDFQLESNGDKAAQSAVADEKFWGAAIAAAISAAPSIYRAVRGKDFEPVAGPAHQAPPTFATQNQPVGTVGGMPQQGAPGDEKFWGVAIAAAISAAPSIYRAVRGKDFQTDVATNTDEPVLDEKVMHILPAILPSMIQMMRRKDFQPDTASATTAPPVGDEKFWGPVIAAAITAAPSIYRAVRGKDFLLS